MTSPEGNDSATEQRYKRTIAVGYTTGGAGMELEDVHLIIPSLERAVTYRASSRGEGSDKLPVCGAVANFLNKNVEVLGDPIFIGFGLPNFLTSLGVGCARAGVYVSPSLWLSGSCKSRGFDLDTTLLNNTAWEGAVCYRKPAEGWDIPDFFKHLSASFEKEEAKAFQELTKEWTPGLDAERDGKVAFLLGSMFRVWG